MKYLYFQMCSLKKVEAYLETNQTSMIGFFVKNVNAF